ncbi:hypothetical protein [Paraburkholderia tropica]|uniref:hypothetical protein n=1 Tax=Paraburkholderia tropica TaxID=92647 RepID=UPI001F40C23C|nr:hypothetical protein [Paraburkholderia tropica]
MKDLNTYLITFEDETSMEVQGIGRDGAQETACDVCDAMGICMPAIVSIRRVNTGKLIESTFVFELKEKILASAASIAKSRTEEDCRLVNRMARELYAMTGEVFSCGQFVKVA